MYVKNILFRRENPRLEPYDYKQTTLVKLELESRVMGNYLARFGEHFILLRECIGKLRLCDGILDSMYSI
jgi:hypothetical protein